MVEFDKMASDDGDYQLSCLLLYHGIVLFLFGSCLTLVPKGMYLKACPKTKKRKSSKSEAIENITEPDERKNVLMIWRICGLWVVCAGLISLHTSNLLPSFTRSNYTLFKKDMQVLIGGAFAIIHCIETVIKLMYEQPIRAWFGNFHFFVLFAYVIWNI